MTKPDVTSLTEVMAVSPDDALNLQETGFQFSWGLLPYELKELTAESPHALKDDPNLVEWEVVLKVRNKEGYITSETPLNYHKCTPKELERDFNRPWGPQKPQFKNIKKKDALYCVDKGDHKLEIYGDVNAGGSSTLVFNYRMCKACIANEKNPAKIKKKLKDARKYVGR